MNLFIREKNIMLNYALDKAIKITFSLVNKFV